MDRIEGIKLDSDEDGYIIILEGDFVDACERYLSTETSNLQFHVNNVELIRFTREIQKTEDYFYLAGRV